MELRGAASPTFVVRLNITHTDGVDVQHDLHASRDAKRLAVCDCRDALAACAGDLEARFADTGIFKYFAYANRGWRGLVPDAPAAGSNFALAVLSRDLAARSLLETGQLLQQAHHVRTRKPANGHRDCAHAVGTRVA